jgi:hypothetical protein
MVVKKLRVCLLNLWEGRAPAHAPPQPTPSAVGRGYFHGRAARAQLGEAARDRSRGVRALGKGRVRRTAHARANQVTRGSKQAHTFVFFAVVARGPNDIITLHRITSLARGVQRPTARARASPRCRADRLWLRRAHRHVLLL